MTIRNLTNTILVATGLALSTLPVSAGNTPSQLGDLILGLRASGGTGASSYVMANLGPAATVRDATTNLSLFSGTALALALSSNFGATWYDRTDLWVGAVMGFEDDEFGPNSGGLNGDSFLTMYASNRRTAVGTAGVVNSASWAPTPNGTITASGNMLDSANAFVAAGTGVATIANSTYLLDWDNRNPFSGNTPGLAFNTFAGGVQAPFGLGIAGNLGGYNAEAMLDLFRMQSDTVNYVNTTFEGTIVIDSAGQVNFVVVPEPSTLSLFAIGAGIAVLRRRRPVHQRALV